MKDRFTPEEMTVAVHTMVTEHPERFDMRSWARDLSGPSSCGTTACMAGWAVELNGAKPKFHTHGDGCYESPRSRYSYPMCGKDEDVAYNAVYPDGTEVNIEQEGARLLGIPMTPSEGPFFLSDSGAVAWLEQRIRRNGAKAKDKVKLSPLTEATHKEIPHDG